MRLKITIIALLLGIYSYPQTIYREVDHSNFRDYAPFSKAIDINNIDYPLLNACIFFATNEIRATKGLSILKYSPVLEESSTIHSKDMAKYNFFGHTNNKVKKHREAEDRARLAGITNPHIAENIIEGFLLQYKTGMQVIIEGDNFIDPSTGEKLRPNTYLSLTDELMRLWMDSKGHRSNILSEKALQLGCGTAIFYMKDFNNMPSIKATQNYQWFEPVQVSQ